MTINYYQKHLEKSSKNEAREKYQNLSLEQKH